MDLATSFVILFFCLLDIKGIFATCQFKIVLSLYSLLLSQSQYSHSFVSLSDYNFICVS